MQPEFRDQLPITVLALLDKLERFSGREIQIEIGLPDVVDPAAGAAVRIGNQGATIRAPSNKLDAVAVYHELLHVQRLWIEGVPRLIPLNVDTQDHVVTTHIENSLEHTVIVPREIKMFPESEPVWTRQLVQGVLNLPSLGADVPVRQNALLSYLGVAKLVTNQTEKAAAMEVLDRLGLLSEAERFAARVLKRVAQQKAQALSIVVDELEIPRREVLLLYVDPRKGTARGAQLPT